jgi:peptidoglycan biosynthesis protein MviN/MurJ (putative lipid II flippase)
MFGAAFFLTLITLLGLVAGFAREWLLVAHWGAGARTDAFVIALFIPEAVRSVLGGGLFASAGLAMWQQQADEARRRHWFSQVHQVLMLGSVALSALVCLGAPWLVQGMAPGLSADARTETANALRVLAWALPGMVAQAWWVLPDQAQGRFLTSGLGSLAYNLPAVTMLAWRGQAASEVELSLAFVAGSLIMAAMAFPGAWAAGLRPVSWQGAGGACGALFTRLAPLLGSAAASQGVVLLERVVASYLGEGVVTALNLARKLVNLPLIALQALNQVLLSRMSRHDADRLHLLKRGLLAVTVFSLPAALGLMLSAPALVRLLFPKVQGTETVVLLLAGYAAVLIPASWNTLLARYHYAEGDTRGPMLADWQGQVVQALSLAPLAWAAGATGIVWAFLLGALLTGRALCREAPLNQGLGMGQQALVSLLALAAGWWLVRPLMADAPMWRLAEAAALSVLACGALALAWRAQLIKKH